MNFASFLPLVLSLLLIACAPAAKLSFVDLETLMRDQGIPSVPKESDYPDDDAVIIMNKTDVEMVFEREGLCTYESVHMVTRIFRNVKEYSSVDIPVYDGEELLDVAARTILPDKRLETLKKEDFLVMSGVGGENVFYSDSKMIRFTFPSVAPGSIIEYKYVKRKARPFIADLWRLQRYVPTVVSRYNLFVPKFIMDLGVTWRYKPYHCTVDKPLFLQEVNSSILKGRHLYYWEKRDIPAFTAEPMMPPESDLIAYVKFAPAEWSQWTDVARWYHYLFYKDQLVLNDEVRSLAAKLTAGCSNDKERIHALYRYVKKLRYVSIALGDGGLRPRTPAEVIRRQYGDCKDKSILLHALLWSVGIEAHPVLVMTSDQGSFDANFPSWNFNHMIVKAVSREREVFWMDGTLEFGRPGDLSWNTEGINVLTIDNDGSGYVETTPRSPHYDNTITYAANVRMENGKGVRFDIEILYEGEHNLMMRSFIDQMSEKDLRDFCKSLIDADYLTSTIDTCRLIGREDEQQPLRLRFGFASSKGMKQQADLTFLQFDPFRGGSFSQAFAKEKRLQPMTLHFPSTTKYLFTVSLKDEPYRLRNRPENISESNQIFTFRSTVTGSENDQITLTEVFGTKQAVIDTASYPLAKQFLEDIRNRSVDNLILVKKP